MGPIRLGVRCRSCNCRKRITKHGGPIRLGVGCRSLTAERGQQSMGPIRLGAGLHSCNCRTRAAKHGTYQVRCGATQLQLPKEGSKAWDLSARLLPLYTA